MGFRFSLSQLLWLPFWVAVLISLWKFIAFVDDNPKPLVEHIQQMMIGSAILFIITGFGAIKKRPKTGAMWGILVALFAVLCMSPTIY